jgi:hypothetical protein
MRALLDTCVPANKPCHLQWGSVRIGSTSSGSKAEGHDRRLALNAAVVATAATGAAAVAAAAIAAATAVAAPLCTARDIA